MKARLCKRETDDTYVFLMVRTSSIALPFTHSVAEKNINQSTLENCYISPLGSEMTERDDSSNCTHIEDKPETEPGQHRKGINFLNDNRTITNSRLNKNVSLHKNPTNVSVPNHALIWLPHQSQI